MFYDNKGGSNLIKNNAKGGFKESDLMNFRETFRGNALQQPSQLPSKKNSNTNVRLEPIMENKLATSNSRVGDFTPDKQLKAPGSLGTVMVGNNTQLVKGKRNNYLLIFLI